MPCTIAPVNEVIKPVVDPVKRQQLFKLLQQHSFKTGQFVLASGKTSNYYMDCRMTTLHAKGAALIGELLYQQLEPYHIDAVGGVVLGAAPMVTAVSTASVSHNNTINGFLVRKESKGHGTGQQIEGHLAPWMRVALIEDVVTSGGSLIKGIKAVQQAYPNVEIVKVISIVDRNAGGKEAIEALGISFDSLYNVDEFLNAAQ